jgi:hypothetical protein
MNNFAELREATAMNLNFGLFSANRIKRRSDTGRVVPRFCRIPNGNDRVPLEYRRSDRP